MSKRETRYVMMRGLAFSETSDMKTLQNLAQDGWQLEGISFCIMFRLRKAEPEQVEYSMDYREDADEDYFEYFRATGWEPVLSAGHIHIFKAPPGTRPLYTDSQTIWEKYSIEKRRFGRYTLFSLPLVALIFVMVALVEAPPDWLYILPPLLIAPFTVSFMTYLGYVTQLAKLKKDKS